MQLKALVLAFVGVAAATYSCPAHVSSQCCDVSYGVNIAGDDLYFMFPQQCEFLLLYLKQKNNFNNGTGRESIPTGNAWSNQDDRGRTWQRYNDCENGFYTQGFCCVSDFSSPGFWSLRTDFASKISGPASEYEGGICYISPYA